MNRLCRTSATALVAAGGIALSASGASANVEIGLTAGLHAFSENNELGVADRPDASSIRNSALFGLRVGLTFGFIGIELEGGAIPSESRTLVFDVWTATYRAHLIAQFRAGNPANKFVPFVVLGGGLNHVVSSDDELVISKDKDETLYAGVGAKYRVDNGWGLRFDARPMIVPTSKPKEENGVLVANDGVTLDFEALISVYKEFGRGEAAKKTEPVAAPGDADGDGIKDDADKCPNEAEDKDDFEDEDGCPDKDNDGDGVADDADKCKAEPEDKDGFQDDDGCPETDNDADGIADAADGCPNEAEDKDNFKDDDGCPDPDNDEDGVLDGADQCPDQQESKNGYQDTDGCPDEIPVAIKKFTGVIKGINFKTGSAEILKTSNRTLDAAVKVLQEYGDLKLEIQGHTDDVADDEVNMTLSQQRADAVKAYMVGLGVDEARLIAKGYGETAPIDPRKTKAARAKNRRVEFKLVSDLTAPPAEATPAPAAPAPETPAPAAEPKP